jgi:hypothetical protein
MLIKIIQNRIMNTFYKMTKQNRIKKTHQNKTNLQNQVNQHMLINMILIKLLRMTL